MTVSTLCSENSPAAAALPATSREAATISNCQCPDYTLNGWGILPQLRDQTSARVSETIIEIDAGAHIVYSIVLAAVPQKIVMLRVACRWIHFVAVTAACKTRIGSNFHCEEAKCKKSRSGQRDELHDEAENDGINWG
jgi:hypothetical protein